MDPNPVLRLPRFHLGPEIMTAEELADTVDWGLTINHVPDQWTKTKGAGVKVAVLDTGRPVHKDIEGNLVGAATFAGGSVDDRNGHSTHVCGTIAASANGFGVVGVAPEAKIITGKVLGDDGSGDSRGIEQGIRWAIDQGADIISMSLGGGYHRGTANALLDAVQAGKFVICAAGNSGESGPNTVEYPGKLSYCLAIAAYNKSGRISDFSSRGPEVVAAFPGEEILSCWPGNKYRKLSGTSMATPFCSGLVALMLANQRALEAAGKPVKDPIKNNSDLRALIQKTSIDDGPPGKDDSWGWGRPDVNAWLNPALKEPVKPTQPVTGSQPFEVPIIGSLLAKFGIRLMGVEIEYNGKRGTFLYLD